MTSEKLNACKRFMIFVLSIFFSLDLFAKMPGQTERSILITNNLRGYLEYLPSTYSTTTGRYPLLINILGLGTQGDGSLASLNNLYSVGGGNPHEQANQDSWQESYTVNGQTFSFIVLTPQGYTDVPQPSDINALIDYAIQHYANRIDTSRIYLIGSSEGGGSVWNYAGGNNAYAKRLAAVMPFGGVAYPVEDKAYVIKHNRVAVWAFHSEFDTQVPSYFTTNFIYFINSGTPPARESKKTLFNSTGHLCWYDPLKRLFTENGMNVYQWLLQFKRSFSSVNAGDYQEITAPTSSIQFNGSGTGPNGSTSTINWAKVSGPSGGNISNASALNPTINNLSPGTYVYRLVLTDNASAQATDTVEIQVNPVRQRIYATDAIASSGVVTTFSTSEGRNIINGIANNDWMDYTISVPTSGNYKLRFRLGTFYGGDTFQVRNSSATILAASPVWWTKGWDNFETLTMLNVPLTAGSQTIRIQNIMPAPGPNRDWYLNWFEIENLVTVDAPLPVAFSLFNTNCLGNGVSIVWKTTSETNSSEFSVQKSSDGRNWKVITTITAAGQSTAEKNYSYIDLAASGNDFYRIVQQDVDGRKTYTSVLRSNCIGAQAFTVFPNPAEGKAIVTISSNKNTKLNLTLMDTKGAVVRKQQTMLPQGNNQITIDLSGLAKGIYTLQAEWNNEIKTTKLIKN
jgi:hypothetical protein